jgi:hypothetical protein
MLRSIILVAHQTEVCGISGITAHGCAQGVRLLWSHVIIYAAPDSTPFSAGQNDVAPALAPFP